MPKHMTMTSTIFALLLAAVPALAEKPTIQVNPFPDAGLVAPTAALCGFDILAVPQAGRPNKGKLILFANGETGVASGATFLTLTNLNTGKSANVNIGGPARLDFTETDKTTLVLLGHGIVAFPPAPLSVTSAAGLPAVPLLYGNATFEIDPQGNILSIRDVHGTAQDVCALLQ